MGAKEILQRLFKVIVSKPETAGKPILPEEVELKSYQRENYRDRLRKMVLRERLKRQTEMILGRSLFTFEDLEKFQKEKEKETYRERLKKQIEMIIGRDTYKKNLIKNLKAIKAGLKKQAKKEKVKKLEEILYSKPKIKLKKLKKTEGEKPRNILLAPSPFFHAQEG